MKKSKLALAVAGADAAPIVAKADIALYGNWDWRSYTPWINRKR